jgi:hypothetical protein
MEHPEPPLVPGALREMYAAFNARDIDRVLAAMSDDVDWRAVIDPTVEPAAVVARPDGTVDHTVRNLAGDLVARNQVHHIYTFDRDLVVRMDVEPG